MLNCLSTVKWILSSVLLAECLSLGLLGGVRRSLSFAGRDACGSIRAAVLVIVCAATALSFLLRGLFPDPWMFALGPLFLLLRLIIDMRGLMGRVGRVNGFALKDLWISCRPHALALLFGAVPICALAFVEERIAFIAVFSAAYLMWAARRGRLSDHDSEKRVAISAMVLCVPLMFSPSLVMGLTLPRYIMLIPGWVVFVSYMCGLSVSRFRYGMVSSGIMFLCALSPLLPVPLSSGVSVILGCGLLFFVYPCIYGLLIGLRARKHNRRLRAQG